MLDLAAGWRTSLMLAIQEPGTAEMLKASALAGRLGEWTRHLTAAVVKSCASLGWRAAAKGFQSTVLPQMGQEYLGIDVMAFATEGDAARDPGPRWQLPVAVFELENSGDDDRVAYSLWKVLCVRAGLVAQLGAEDPLDEQYCLECRDVDVCQSLETPAHALAGHPKCPVDVIPIRSAQDHVAGPAGSQFDLQLTRFHQLLQSLQEFLVSLRQFHVASASNSPTRRSHRAKGGRLLCTQ